MRIMELLKQATSLQRNKKRKKKKGKPGSIELLKQAASELEDFSLPPPTPFLTLLSSFFLFLSFSFSLFLFLSLSLSRARLVALAL